MPVRIIGSGLTGVPYGFPPRFSVGTCRIFRKRPRGVLRSNSLLSLNKQIVRMVRAPNRSPKRYYFCRRKQGCLCSNSLICGKYLCTFCPAASPRLFCRSMGRIRGFGVREVVPNRRRLGVPISLVGAVRTKFTRLREGKRLGRKGKLFRFKRFRVRV